MVFKTKQKNLAFTRLQYKYTKYLSSTSFYRKLSPQEIFDPVSKIKNKHAP